jgi:hypothetical protein
MFDNTPNDLYSTLLEMDLRARERCRFDQIAAKEKMKGWIAHDQRFRDFDADRVVESLQRARSCGGQFDVTDPGLKRGGQSRPEQVSGRSRWTRS